MSILIEEVDFETYSKKVGYLDGILPLWLSPKFVTAYKEKILLLATNGKEVKGVWVIPITSQDGLKIAKRNYRFFPYSSPIFFDKDNLKRRDMAEKFFEYVGSKCESIYLPLAPDFKDMATIQEQGALIEWRHTHIMSNPIDDSQIDSRLRNHIKNAKNYIEISIEKSPNNFNFELAIKGGADEQKERRESAINLLSNKQAVIVTAKKDGKLCAGILLAYDEKTAYMMHSWQMEGAPRGTISYLIYESINWTFKVGKLKYFDFEGSVIQNIDYFFGGFNAEIVPYGFIHWSHDKNKLHNLIDRSINIEGRLLTKNCE
ncbi:MAG: hypothetical protein WC503_04505 [Candidatus Shapirobacteria bacterium]